MPRKGLEGRKLTTHTEEEFKLFLVLRGLTDKTVQRHLVVFRKLQKEWNGSEADLQHILSHIISTSSPANYNKWVQTIKLIYKHSDVLSPKWLKYHREAPKPRRVLTDDEIKALIDFDPPPSKYGLFWKLLAFTGQRTYEIAQLRKGDIDITRESISIYDTKRKETRDIVIHSAAIPDLALYIEQLSTDLLFPSRQNPNEHISNATINQNLRHRLKQLGITKQVTAYTMRHSFINGALDNDADLFDVMYQVGQSNPKTTLKYKRTSLKSKKRAVNKLPLGEAYLSPGLMLQKFKEHVASFKLNPKDFVVAQSQTESSFSLSVSIKTTRS